MGKVELRWPGWMTRETVAAYTDLRPGAIDQYVKRGLLPEPHPVGEARLWSKEEVDRAIGGEQSDPAAAPQHHDPYIEGLNRAAPSIQGRAAVPRALRTV